MKEMPAPKTARASTLIPNSNSKVSKFREPKEKPMRFLYVRADAFRAVTAQGQFVSNRGRVFFQFLIGIDFFGSDSKDKLFPEKIPIFRA